MSYTKNCEMCRNWDGERFVCRITGAFSPASNICPSFSSVPCCLSCRHWDADKAHPGYGRCAIYNGISHANAICRDNKYEPRSAPADGKPAGKLDIILSFVKEHATAFIAGALALLVIILAILLIGKFLNDKAPVPEEPPVEDADPITPEEPENPEETENPDKTAEPEKDKSLRYINADSGLNLRKSPDTDSEIICLMKDGGTVKLLTERDGWSNVIYEGAEGWCSSEYLTEEPNSFWAKLPIAREEANKVIDLYRHKAISRGRTTMNMDTVREYLVEAAELTAKTESDFPSVLGTVAETRSDGDKLEFASIDSTKFKTVEDVCEFYFAFYSDETASKLLRDRVCVIDSKLYVSTESASRSGGNICDEVKISENDGSYFVTVTSYDGDKKIDTAYYPCELEDGIWVFTRAPYLHDIVDWSGSGTLRIILRALYDVRDNYTAPDGASLGDYDGVSSYGSGSDNEFSLFDFDGDGNKELGIRWDTAEMAKKSELLYELRDGKWHLEISATINLVYYSNGIVIANLSHNDTNGNTVWPYLIYRYNKATDSYDEVGSVECWDKSFREKDPNGIAFPDKVDTDKCGTVYKISYDGYKKDGFAYSQSDYDKFLRELTGSASKVSPVWLRLTEENIRTIG